MLDAATISGLIRPVKFTDANRFQQVAFLQENGTTFKHTDGYYQSPLTGAQFRMTPVKERHKSDIYWRLHIWLPVNAILRGQNYLLGEHTDIPSTLHTLAKFIRLFLLHFGFTPSEVQYFIDTARLEDMEPSYHVSCSSPKAAANAQKRLLRHLECLSPLRLAHYRLWKVKVMRTNKAMTTYAHVDRAMLRTYLKALLARPTERKARMVGFIAENMKPFAKRLRAAVASDIRVEPFLERGMLVKHGIDDPRTLDPEKVLTAIEDVFTQAGLTTPFVKSLDEVNQTGLHVGVRNTLHRYFAGEDLNKSLTPATRSRHGAILRKRGVEIGVSLRDHRAELSGTIGKQIGYANRRKPPVELLPLMLTRKFLSVLNAYFDKEIAIVTARFDQATHDMREMERQQGVFLFRCRDPYLSDWLRPVSAPQHPEHTNAKAVDPERPRKPPLRITIGGKKARGVGSVPVVRDDDENSGAAIDS